MGWAGGSELADNIWSIVREYIPESDRKDVANDIIDAFESEDCDTMQEAEQLWEDAERLQECWDCGTPTEPIELDGDGLCADCASEVED